MGVSYTASVAGMRAFQALHLVRTDNVWIGIGKPTPWNESDSVPEVSGSSQLSEPIGYKKAEKVRFVVPDAEGDIVQFEQRWKIISEVEAMQSFVRWVYVAAWITGTELPAVSYRQSAIVTDLELAAETLPGKLAVKAEEVGNHGYALVVNNRSPIHRTEDQREFLEFIVEF
ncbi:hypothetical protein [Paenibacillus harenae]|uniref:Uncharacterized protein n=1 Tax=Paenibacillus harenae TaxID=306543 RepID=A0ABT9TY78_PAEHA|nr:hypothetical protein [Paenibacillus harenae]MDQ0060131.1 hypothetical protein [Paenibacillus harenae]MDQ0112318.1 hypothetical protein [Paenibacillus harenae]